VGCARVVLVSELLGYARVSTAQQDAALQHDELRAAGCWKTWTDVASGARVDRPQLAAVLGALRPGDTLVVWRLDRLGRSLRESIDTTTPGGRLVFHVFGALASFERELVQERTRAGLDAARARGRLGGRPTVLTPAKARQARKMRDEGATMDEIASVVGVSVATLYRRLDIQVGQRPSR